jgi:HemY protein
MVKLLWRFALLILAAIAFAWLADRPGSITIQWLNREIHLSVLVGVVVLAVGLAALYFLWRLSSRIWRSPSTAREYWRFRKHRKAYDSLSRGIIAAGAGDAQTAAKHAAIAGNTLRDEPLITLLTAQAAQLKGDRAGVKAAFEGMTKSPETELLGLRGLFAEAKQAGDWAAAGDIANRALAKNPRLPWASTAVLQVQITAKNWAAAAHTIANQAKAGLLPRDEAARKQAALLTAQALAEEESNREHALSLATEAYNLDVGLVPAALVAARIHMAQNNPRKAKKILRATYAHSPHPDLVDVMAHVKPGEGAEEQFERVRDLVGDPEKNLEGAFAFARAAVAAKRWEVARDALRTFALDQPQPRICGLMAEIENAQGEAGRSREWLARAMHAPRDPIWVSDGVASTRWTPVSPVTGEIVPCEWKPPFEVLAGSNQLFSAANDTPLLAAKTEETKSYEKSDSVRRPDDPGID